MSHIKTIEIKNFKSIRHQKIEDCRRVNVFIGYPNVGKSNILEALGLFSIDTPDADFNSFVRSEELTTLFFDGNVDENIEIKINNDNKIIASISEPDRVHFSWLQTADDASFDETIDGGQQKKFLILNFSKISGENKISGWDSIFKRIPRSPELYKELGKGYLASIKKYGFKKNSPYSSDRYSSLDVPNGENLFDIIHTHPKIRKEIANLFEFYKLKLLYNSADRKFSILKNLSEDVIFTIPYALIADTLQRLIFYKAAILSNKNSVLLFEEPEAHMFPPYIRKMTADIMFDKNDNQYFIATHSPYVLDELVEELEDDLSVYLVDYKEGETKIIYLSREDLREVRDYGVDLFFNIESYLKNGQVHNA